MFRQVFDIPLKGPLVEECKDDGKVVNAITCNIYYISGFVLLFSRLCINIGRNRAIYEFYQPDIFP